MSVNILELAKGALGGSVMDQLGGMLGENRANTQSAVDGALPAILGGLMQGVSTPQGAQEYSRMADESDPGIMDNLSGLISGNSGTLLALGAPLLLKMFGGKQDGIIGTLARVAGIGGGSAGTLLKVLAPIVMSLIGKKKREMSLNTDQFASMLMDQRQHVTSSMPAEISQSMGFGDFMGSMGSGAASAAGAATAAAGAATATATSAVHGATETVSQAANDAGSSGGGLLKTLLPAALIAVIGYFGYTQFFAGPSAPSAEQMESTNAAMTTVSSASGEVSSAISGITDVESAQAAVGTIEGATATLDGVNLDGMGEAGKAQVTGMLGGLVGGIEKALETAYKIPGVQGVIEPAVKPFLEKLSGL